jgi:hypothetical protein
MYWRARRVADGRLLQKEHGVKFRKVHPQAQKAYDQAAADSKRLGLDVRRRDPVFHGTPRQSRAKVTVAPTSVEVAIKNQQLLTKIVRQKAIETAARTLKATADRKHPRGSRHYME